jgi:hypothetical protein
VEKRRERKLTLDVGLRVDLLVVLLLGVLGVENRLGVVLNVVDCEGHKQTEPTSGEVERQSFEEIGLP